MRSQSTDSPVKIEHRLLEKYRRLPPGTLTVYSA
jgi:hypothetical protein